MATFLRWWLFFSLILLGTGVGIFTGTAKMVNAGDITKLSFLTYAVFIIFTLRVGYASYLLTKCQVRRDISKMGWFVSNILMTLGIIGTVVGLIYALSTTFVNLDPSNRVLMQSALVNMSKGMSTALFTTAMGLVCSLLLRLQLYNLDHGYGDSE